MKLTALLLGSAAAFSVVGGAQAADLAVAEPVSYVKLCDALYGVGFFYVPGSDTCLKITAYAQVNVSWMSNPAGRDYMMLTEAGIGAVGMWNGGAGEGSVVIKIKATDDATNVVLDKGYFTFAGLLLGYAANIAYNSGSLDTDMNNFDFADFTNTQIAYTGAAGPVSFGIGIGKGSHWTGNGGWGELPDIMGYVGFTAGGVGLKVSALLGDEVTANPYGVSINATGTVGAVGLQAGFSWVHDDASLIGGPAGGLGDWWSAVASFKIPVGAMSLGGMVSALDGPATGPAYEAALRLSYAMGTNVTGWLELDGHRDTAGNWTYGVNTRLKAALPGS